MISLARLFRVVGGALTIACMPGLSLSKDATVQTLPMGKSPVSDSAVAPVGRFTCNGIVFIAGKPLASLMDNIARTSGWFGVDADVSEFVVKEVTVKGVVLVSRGNNQEVRIPLAAASIKEVVAGRSGPAPFSKAWINSKANPMLHSLQPLPIEVYRNWPSLSDAEKEEIIRFYLKHGWKLIAAETIGGATNFAWENIYEKERAAVMAANRDAFIQTLSRAQAEAWARIHSKPNLTVVNGQLTEEQKRERDERRRDSAQFMSGLTDSQKQAHAAINDFTTAAWND